MSPINPLSPKRLYRIMAIIGIDLGTSNPAATVLRGGRPVIIPSAEVVSLGGKAYPSYVAVAADGQVCIGEPARRQAAANPEGTATAFKRRMGSARPSSCAIRSSPPSSCLPFCCRRSSAMIPAASSRIRCCGSGTQAFPGRWKGKATGICRSGLRICGEDRSRGARTYERLRALARA